MLPLNCFGQIWLKPQLDAKQWWRRNVKWQRFVCTEKLFPFCLFVCQQWQQANRHCNFPKNTIFCTKISQQELQKRRGVGGLGWKAALGVKWGWWCEVWCCWIGSSKLVEHSHQLVEFLILLMMFYECCPWFSFPLLFIWLFNYYTQ